MFQSTNKKKTRRTSFLTLPIPPLQASTGASGTWTAPGWCVLTARCPRTSRWSCTSTAVSPSEAAMENICVETREARWRATDSGRAVPPSGSTEKLQCWAAAPGLAASFLSRIWFWNREFAVGVHPTPGHQPRTEASWSCMISFLVLADGERTGENTLSWANRALDGVSFGSPRKWTEFRMKNGFEGLCVAQWVCWSHSVSASWTTLSLNHQHQRAHSQQVFTATELAARAHKHTHPGFCTNILSHYIWDHLHRSAASSRLAMTHSSSVYFLKLATAERF